MCAMGTWRAMGTWCAMGTWRALTVGVAVAALIVGCQPSSVAPTTTATRRPIFSFGPAPTASSPATASSTVGHGATAGPVATAAPAPDLEPEGPTQQAEVVRVTDGDTITVEIDGTSYDVRYIGIDSPEKASPFTDPEPFGAEATQANELLVGGRTVHLESDRTQTDRFDRLLRYVWLQTDDGWRMANREMVRLGLAESRAYRPDTKWQDVLDDAELDARAEGLGMWGAPPPPTIGAGPIATPKRFLGDGCDPAYPDGCIPRPPPDLDCADVSFRRFTVLPPDPHNFDGDLNGIGCEAQ